MSMRYIDRFQQVIVIILTWMMAFVVLVATVDLVYVLARDLILPPIGLQIGESLNFFGLILLVLIGVELLETFKSFDLDKNDCILVVIPIAIIAVARRIVLFDLNGASDEIALASLGVIMISLAAAYYLVKKTKGNAD